MSGLGEKLAENFLRWAARGCGGQLHSAPVLPVPRLVPFPGHRLPLPAKPDDGRRDNFFSRLTRGAKQILQPPRTVPLPASKEFEPYWLGKEAHPPGELRLLLPPEFAAKQGTVLQFLASLDSLQAPVSFEIAGTKGQSVLQLAAGVPDLRALHASLSAHFPGIVIQPTEGHFAGVWGDPEDGDERVIVEFALALPFMLPLTLEAKTDPFVGLVAAMSGAGEDEAVVYQVTFMPVEESWNLQTLASVTGHDGKPFFEDGQSLLKWGHGKQPVRSTGLWSGSQRAPPTSTGYGNSSVRRPLLCDSSQPRTATD